MDSFEAIRIRSVLYPYLWYGYTDYPWIIRPAEPLHLALSLPTSTDVDVSRSAWVLLTGQDSFIDGVPVKRAWLDDGVLVTSRGCSSQTTLVERAWIDDGILITVMTCRERSG